MNELQPGAPRLAVFDTWDAWNRLFGEPFAEPTLHFLL
jgi:hypothetical protein